MNPLILLYKIGIAAAVAGVIALFSWPFKKLTVIHDELTTQRTNCLATLAQQGDTQIDLLGKAVNILEDMHLDQRELLGRIDK
jgi:hypothetical protein